MSDPVEALIADLLEWIGPARDYPEVMEAWRTSCPRLPVWEEAHARGLLGRRRDGAGPVQVCPTQLGLAWLGSRRTRSEASPCRP
jgi:hypothetical protein